MKITQINRQELNFGDLTSPYIYVVEECFDDVMFKPILALSVSEFISLKDRIDVAYIEVKKDDD